MQRLRQRAEVAWRLGATWGFAIRVTKFGFTYNRAKYIKEYFMTAEPWHPLGQKLAAQTIVLPIPDTTSITDWRVFNQLKTRLRVQAYILQVSRESQ